MKRMSCNITPSLCPRRKLSFIFCAVQRKENSSLTPWLICGALTGITQEGNKESIGIPSYILTLWSTKYINQTIDLSEDQVVQGFLLQDVTCDPLSLVSWPPSRRDWCFTRKYFMIFFGKWDPCGIFLLQLCFFIRNGTEVKSQQPYHEYLIFTSVQWIPSAHVLYCYYFSFHFLFNVPYWSLFHTVAMLKQEAAKENDTVEQHENLSRWQQGPCISIWQFSK